MKVPPFYYVRIKRNNASKSPDGGIDVYYLVWFPFLPQHDKLIKPLSLTKNPGFNSRLNNLPNYYSEVLAVLRIFVLIHLTLTISIVHSSWFWGLLCSLALESKIDRPAPPPAHSHPHRPCQLSQLRAGWGRGIGTEQLYQGGSQRMEFSRVEGWVCKIDEDITLYQMHRCISKEFLCSTSWERKTRCSSVMGKIKLVWVCSHYGILCSRLKNEYDLFVLPWEELQDILLNFK